MRRTFTSKNAMNMTPEERSVAFAPGMMAVANWHTPVLILEWGWSDNQNGYLIDMGIDAAVAVYQGDGFYWFPEVVKLECLSTWEQATQYWLDAIDDDHDRMEEIEASITGKRKKIDWLNKAKQQESDVER